MKQSPMNARKVPVRAVSPKRENENEIYRERREAFLAANRRCQIRLAGCGVWSNEVQHRITRGARIDLWLDPENWVAACTPCHRHVTDNPNDGYVLGVCGHAWDVADSPKIVPRPELRAM